MGEKALDQARVTTISREIRKGVLPSDKTGKLLPLSSFYGELVFDFFKESSIPKNVRSEVEEACLKNKPILKKHAQVIAKAVTNWAKKNGATHFCHWFQPLTGLTAEKHDAFLAFNDAGEAIEKLSASQLLQGEPDASSFPNGGSRSTFEARGYTTWDISSPIFISEGPNGKTVCIPTAFISYYGDALDIKTPLLRSVKRVSEVATKFLKLTGKKDAARVLVTCGPEQEYFLVDKAFYYLRPDLLMCGRTLFGSLTAKNQQLEDHYFGTIPARVLAFMQELDYELYRLGIPSKTRHNEVAPGQFEVAAIFKEGNLSADQNQLVMATLQRVSQKHDFVVLLHEKPFSGINGSGKHLNWSLADNTGFNLLDPGDNPEENHRFLAFVAIIIEAVNRHAGLLRMSIAGHGNDHRLGANEAPPSIISVYLGQRLTDIFESIVNGTSFNKVNEMILNLGSLPLATLLQDNSDRNRTSPFAFTGNRFEFRAVGSSQATGFPQTILNAAVTEVLEESNIIIEKELKSGRSIDEALLVIIKKWYTNSSRVVFNGDGYGQEWVQEAHRRGLPNMRTSPEAIAVLDSDMATAVLTNQGIFKTSELKTRFNVILERYIKHREIEISTLKTMVNQYVVPSTLDFKKRLLDIMLAEKTVGLSSLLEDDILKVVSKHFGSLKTHIDELERAEEKLHHMNEGDKAKLIAQDIMPIMQKVAADCNRLEEMIPDENWKLPKYQDMLFLR